MRAAKALEQKLAALSELSTTELKARWQSSFGKPPPPRLSRDLLQLAAAYQLQSEVHSALRAATVKRLKRLIQDVKAEQPIAGETSVLLTPGTRLVREWRGETHVVDVLEAGFAWRDDHYTSLTAIARAMTGTSRSGPSFFGLKDKRHRLAPTIERDLTQ